MPDVLEPTVGETWAYRAHRGDTLVPVVVTRLGVKTPRRVLVRFVDDEFEGRQDWVPPARLKAPWPDVANFIAMERRWDAVTAATPARDDAVVSAAGVVFDLLIRPELATLGYNATDGVVRIHDVDGLAELLDMDPQELRADPVSFEEDGDLIASWEITKAVALQAAERDPHSVLLHVERQETDARRDAVHGRHYGRRGPGQGIEISPEICAQVDEERGGPVRAILREWCGQEPVELRSEIVELRKEVARLGTLAQAALDTLGLAGHGAEVGSLERKHGPVRREDRRADGGEGGASTQLEPTPARSR